MTNILLLILFPFFTVQPIGDISVEWAGDTTFDFGDMARHKSESHRFVFKNTSTVPIVIDNVRTSCGCTTPDWDETPILPDSTAFIDVEYDARDTGYFHKKIKVFFSGRRKGYKLYVEGYVE